MKTITDHTKIAEIIDEDISAIDALANLSKSFITFKNPFLRKYISPRITVATAAKIGSCSVKEIADVLLPLGFIYQENNLRVEASDIPPTWLKNKESEKIFNVDVKVVLESGRDPFAEIVARYKQLRVGEVLCVKTSFVPHALLQLMSAGKYAHTHVKECEGSTFCIYLLKLIKERDEFILKSLMSFYDEAPFFKLINEFSDEQLIKVDIEGLNYDEQLIRIKQVFNSLKEGQVVYIKYNHIPCYFLEMLGYQLDHLHVQQKDEGEVKMLVVPKYVK